MRKTYSFDAVCDAAAKWAVYAIVFAAPFSKSIAEIGMGVAIAVWFMRRLSGRRFEVRNNDLLIPFVVFALSSLPSFINTAHMALSLKALVTKMLKYVFLYFAVLESMDTREKLKDLFIIAALSMLIVTIDGFVQYYYAWTDGLHFPGYPLFKFRPMSDLDTGFFRGFPTACFPYPNDLAAWLLLVLIPLTTVAMFGMRDMKFRYGLAIVAISMCYLFVLTKVRAAWIGLGISALYIAISKNKAWLVIIVVAIVAVPYLLKMEMAEYIFQIGSMGDRVSMWGTSWEIFMRHPFIGNGINTFFLNFMKLRNDEFKDKKGSYAHNCYLQMAGDVGLVGLSGFLFLMGSYFYSIIKGLRRVADPLFGSAAWGISIGVFAFLIHSMFDTNLYSLNLAAMFWISIGISQSIIKVAAEKR